MQGCNIWCIENFTYYRSRKEDTAIKNCLINLIISKRLKSEIKDSKHSPVLKLRHIISKRQNEIHEKSNVARDATFNLLNVEFSWMRIKLFLEAMCLCFCLFDNQLKVLQTLWLDCYDHMIKANQSESTREAKEVEFSHVLILKLKLHLFSVVNEFFSL